MSKWSPRKTGSTLHSCVDSICSAARLLRSLAPGAVFNYLITRFATQSSPHRLGQQPLLVETRRVKYDLIMRAVFALSLPPRKPRKYFLSCWRKMKIPRSNYLHISMRRKIIGFLHQSGRVWLDWVWKSWQELESWSGRYVVLAISWQRSKLQRSGDDFMYKQGDYSTWPCTHRKFSTLTSKAMAVTPSRGHHACMQLYATRLRLTQQNLFIFPKDNQKTSIVQQIRQV